MQSVTRFFIFIGASPLRLFAFLALLLLLAALLAPESGVRSDMAALLTAPTADTVQVVQP